MKLQSIRVLLIILCSLIYADRSFAEKSSGELYPEFTVAVKVTPEAEKALKKTKKGVTVYFEFGNDLGPDSVNSIYVYHNLKGHNGGTFSTKELKLSKKQLKKIGTNYDAAVSASSTHNSKDSFNILRCEDPGNSVTLPANIKNLLNQEVVISCSLLK